MIYELDRADYATVCRLFDPLVAFQPACRAVLEGIYPGRVFVDDREYPRAALLTTILDAGSVWCFLAGDPDDEAFNRALNRAIFKRTIVGQDAYALLFTCHPENWHGQLAVACEPREPVPMLRRHYVCRDLAYDWRAGVPDDITVRRLDRALLDHPSLTVPDEVREILTRWRSVADEDERFADFGFVAIHAEAATHEAKVAAWATVDFVAGNAGDIGFYTQELYRRRGLATVVTAAALEHALAHGLSQVSWTCAQNNLGSVRTAEKLGCRRERDYVMYTMAYDEAYHLAQLAYAHLEAGRYQEAVMAYEQFRARSDDLPPWYHHDLARTWAAMGEKDRAVAHLNAAADKGWDDIDDTRACSEFQALHGGLEWDAVLDRIAQNR